MHSTSYRTTQSNPGSYSPLMETQYSDQSAANLTAAWSLDKSSIEGISGRDKAADTHRLLRDMASHNTAYNDIITMSLELHVNTRGVLQQLVFFMYFFIKRLGS